MRYCKVLHKGSPIKTHRHKHSSLFVIVISDEEKKFYNIDTWSMELDWGDTTFAPPMERGKAN